MSHKQKDPLIVRLVGWLFLAAIIITPVYYYSSFEQIAGEHLDLTPWDLKMIPVGMLAFFLFWKAMEKFVFAPFLRLNIEREAITSGAMDTAQDLLAEAESIQQKYTDKINEARATAVKAKLDKLETARKEASEIIAQAENQAATIIESARSDLETNANKIRTDLLSEIESLANDIVQKLKTKPELTA